MMKICSTTLLTELEATKKRLDIIGDNTDNDLTKQLSKECAFTMSQILTQVKAAFDNEQQMEKS